MVAELIALGGTLDRSCKKRSIGGSAYALRMGDDYLLIDSGLYPEQKLEAVPVNSFPVKMEEVGGCKLPMFNDLKLPSFEDLSDQFGLPQYDFLKNAKNIYNVVTHAHLDHAGSTPALRRLYGDRVKIYMTEATFAIASWSWQDTLKLAENNHRHSAYGKKDVDSLFLKKGLQFVSTNETVQAGPFELTFFSSGHILGGVSVLVRVKKPEPVSLFFTSDICFHDQNTMLGAPQLSPEIIGDVDYIVTESTYGGKSSAERSRKDTESEFVREIEYTLQNSGKVLLPTLAIGRSAEVMSILSHYGVLGRWPVWLDGSARNMLDIYAKYGIFAEEKKQKLLRKIPGRNPKDRLAILESREPCVILAPSGMLTGGWSTFYAKHMVSGWKNLVALTCYQVPNLPGFNLLRTRSGNSVWFGDKYSVIKRAQTRQFNFSSHATHKDLISFVNRMNPKKGVFLIHGEESSMQALQSALPDKNLKPTYVGEAITL